MIFYVNFIYKGEETNKNYSFPFFFKLICFVNIFYIEIFMFKSFYVGSQSAGSQISNFFF
jgi:hypothetical protein